MTATARRNFTNPQLLHVDINETGRDFAVGDIHGCFGALQLALDSIGFSATKDRLFAVGDLVDRGPESDQVLHWLDQPWFHAICGNHDFMAWRRALGDPYQSVDHVDHGGSWLHTLDQVEQRLIGHRLAALPLAMEVDTPEGPVGLVHADCPYDDWHAMQDQALSASAQDCCLWSQERYLRGYVSHPGRLHRHSQIPAVPGPGSHARVDWENQG